MSKHKEQAISVALQIAYEYDDWGEEHVSEMLDTYKATGERAPCTYDELMDLTSAAAKLREKGMSYDAAEAEMRRPR